MMDFFVREARAIVEGDIVIVRFGSCGYIGLEDKEALGKICVAPNAFSVTRNFDFFEIGSEMVDGIKPYRFSKVCKSDEGLTKLVR